MTPQTYQTVRFSIVFTERQWACKTVAAKLNLWARLRTDRANFPPTGWDRRGFLKNCGITGAGGCVFHCDTPRTNDLGRVPVWRAKQADPSKWILLPPPALLIHQRYWFPIDRQTSSWCSPSGAGAHWFTATWSITSNGTPARTAVHNYLPLYGLMGAGEDYNWSIQWINKQKSPWQNAGKSSKPLATTPTPILPLPICTFALVKRRQHLEAFIASYIISEKVPTHGECLVGMRVKSFNAFLTWITDSEKHSFLLRASISLPVNLNLLF